MSDCEGVGTSTHAYIRNVLQVWRSRCGRRRLKQEAVEEACCREDGGRTRKTAPVASTSARHQAEEEREAKTEQELDKGRYNLLVELFNYYFYIISII